MSMQYIRNTYNVPAKRGGHIKITTSRNKDVVFEGVIVGSRGAYLRVRVEGQKHLLTYHPTRNIEYL